MTNWTIDDKKVVRYFGIAISAAPNLEAGQMAIECCNEEFRKPMPERQAQELFVYAYQKAQIALEVMAGTKEWEALK